jgi:hypothetical protein
MLKCKKCKGRMFLDRQYTTVGHLETYCMSCGSRSFYNPPESSAEGSWLLKREVSRAKATMSSL